MKNLLVDVRTFEVRPEEIENISSAHETMRAVNGFALAVPSPDESGYRIFPPDVWRNRYYTYIYLEPHEAVLVVTLGNHPTHPTRTHRVDLEKVEVFWEKGLQNLLLVSSAIRAYHLMAVAENILVVAEKFCQEVAK